MAKQEQPREDIMREATALSTRIELAVPDFPDAVVIGFRPNGAASVYFGESPVLHFNVKNELRRAYLDDKLVKAEKSKLVWLERRRTESEVQLIRDEFTAQRQEELLAKARRQLTEIGERLSADQFRVMRQFPSDTDVMQQVRRWLDSLPDSLEAAARPHVG